MAVVRRRWPISVTLAAAILAACGSGDTGVQVPALEIRTTTAGTELDPDVPRIPEAAATRVEPRSVGEAPAPKKAAAYDADDLEIPSFLRRR